MPRCAPPAFTLQAASEHLHNSAPTALLSGSSCDVGWTSTGSVRRKSTEQARNRPLSALIPKGWSQLFRLRLVFPNFRIPVQNFLKSENPTPVQTLAIIDATEIKQCFNLRNDVYKNHANSWNCRKYQVTPDQWPPLLLLRHNCGVFIWTFVSWIYTKRSLAQMPWRCFGRESMVRFVFSNHDRSQCKTTPAFFSMRHFGHFSLKHFGHLSHSCMKLAAVFISLHFQTSWPKSPNFFGRFKNILVCDRKKENNTNHRCAAANRTWICCAWFIIRASLSKLHLKALVFLYAFEKSVDWHLLLDVSQFVMILSLCYEILIVVLSLFFLCCYFSLSTFHL